MFPMVTSVPEVLALRAACERVRAELGAPEVPVGICLDRKPALLVSMLGVMRAGGFYVPLDPNYPKERLFAILDDSGAPVLVTEDTIRGMKPGSVVVDLAGREDVPSGAWPCAPLLMSNTSRMTISFGPVTCNICGRVSRP